MTVQFSSLKNVNLAQVRFGDDLGDIREFFQKFNIQKLQNAQQVGIKSMETFGFRPVVLSLAGYSAAPKGYEEPTTEFLTKLSDKLGQDLGIVTSPTADKGSIDAIGTIVSLNNNTPILYVTADGYLEYINPANFPESIKNDESKLTKYRDIPKYSFPSGEEYSRATAVASNALLVTGGRDVTVSDFVNAIKAGNKVVILDNPDLGEVNWDEKKSRPNNGAAYLKAQLAAAKKGEALPYAELSNKGFNRDFLKTYANQLDRLVKIVNIKDVEGAATFLKS